MRGPCVVKDFAAKWPEMEQPRKGHIVAACTTAGEGRDAKRAEFVDGLRQLVVCLWDGDPVVFENIAAIGQHRRLRAIWHAVERRTRSVKIALGATNKATADQIRASNFIHIVCRVSQRRVVEKRLQRFKQPVRDIFAFPHDHPGHEVKRAGLFGKLCHLSVPQLQIWNRFNLDRDAGFLFKFGQDGFGELEMSKRWPTDCQGRAAIIGIRIGMHRLCRKAGRST